MESHIEKCECHIHSLDGGLAEATILKRIGDNRYIAQYGDVKCTAVFNPFAGRYYVDDKYGVIKEPKERGAERQSCAGWAGRLAPILRR